MKKVKLSNRTILTLLIIGIVSVAMVQSYQKFQNDNDNSESFITDKTENNQSNNKKATLQEKPKIVLKESSISADSFDDIDYLSYVLSASDDQDGNLIDSVTFRVIDETSSSQVVQYSVEDSDGHTASSELFVRLNEK